MHDPPDAAPAGSGGCRYGDLPLEPHLAELNRHVLERFERSDGDLTAVGDVHRWSEAKKLSTTCPEDAASADPERPGTSRRAVGPDLAPAHAHKTGTNKAHT